MVDVTIGAHTYDAQLTIERVGPFGVTGGQVMDLFTLDFGSRGAIAFSVKGELVFVPPGPATFKGDGPLVSGTKRFEHASGVFFAALTNDFGPVGTTVKIPNGQLCGANL